MIYSCPYLESSLVSESDATAEYYDGGVPDVLVDPTADLISVLKLRVLGELWFFAEAG